VLSSGLSVGDIIYDAGCEDIGILIRCIESADHLILEGEVYAIAAWEIYWMKDGIQFYSDYGLVGRLNKDEFLHLGKL